MTCQIRAGGAADRLAAEACGIMRGDSIRRNRRPFVLAPATASRRSGPRPRLAPGAAAAYSYRYDRPQQLRSAAPRRPRHRGAGRVQGAGSGDRPGGVRRCRARSGSVLGLLRARARVVGALEPGARLAAAACQMVRRRQDQRERQLPRSPRPDGAPQQGGADLGRRARRPAHADVLGSLSRSQPVRQRAPRPGREARRPRRDLSADDSRAPGGDARVRAHRRRPQRGVRRASVPCRCATASTTPRRPC